MPKQFLKIFNDKSLLELTLERLNGIPYIRRPIIITSNTYKFYVINLLNKLKLDCQIILEPEAKNTTAAIYLASCITKVNEDYLLILPSDHLIPDKNKFQRIIETTRHNINNKNWYLFGIKPKFPSISYGYIQTKNGSKMLREVINFIEKPNIEKATKMLMSKNYFWNTGIFFGQSKMIINSIKTYAEDISNSCDKVLTKTILNKANQIINLDKAAFKEIRSISIDYAVIEKEKNIMCMIFDSKWSDIGSWESFFENKCNDDKNNNIFQVDGENQILSANNRTIATLGVKNLMVIDSDDALLITKKNQSENLKSFLDLIKLSKPEVINANNYEERPWGRFDVLMETETLKVKMLTIYPDKRLSLQYHKRRSEHWFIVKGQASIHLDGREFILNQGNSIDIPLGKNHFIGNDTSSELIIIEIQQGNYLKEDDIIRLDDPYERDNENH